MKPWKRLRQSSILLVDQGVLQWGHGDEAVEEFVSPSSWRAHPRCFNGATAMKPWKRSTNTDGER